MATTVTYDEIRDNLTTLLEAASPVLRPEYLFRHAPRHADFFAWATERGSAALRAFQIIRGTNELADPPYLHSTAVERQETATLTVVYPAFTDDLDELERTLREDGTLIRRVLFTPDTYLPGQSLAWITPLEPTRETAVWFQPYSVRLVYLEPQTLT